MFASYILIIIALILIFSSTITNIVNNAVNIWNKHTKTGSISSTTISNNFGASISSTIGSGAGVILLLIGTALLGIKFRNMMPHSMMPHVM
jgi:hypothetical protein